MAKKQKNFRRIMTRKIMRNMIKNKMKQKRIPHINKNLKSVLENANNKEINKMLEIKEEK